MSRLIRIGVTGGETPFDLNLDDYLTTGMRVAILGASGSGKGYLLGKIIEGAIEHGVPVIGLDAEQELWTFKELGALVIGGQHADAPFVENRDAIDAVIRFALSTRTPVIFDVGLVAEAMESEASRLGEMIMQRVYAIEDKERIEMVFAATEASIFAPQQVPRGMSRPEVMRQMFQRGRKRGINPVIETQRIADIQKSVISQANVPFWGYLNRASEFNKVKGELPARTYAQQAALPQGTFYVSAPFDCEVIVAPRRVTHGGGGPAAGEITIRETERVGLDDVLAILNAAAAKSGGSDSSPSNEAAKSEPRLSTEQGTGTALNDLTRERDDALKAKAAAETRAAQDVARMREREQTALAASDAAQAAVERMSARLEAVDSLTGSLRALLGSTAVGDGAAAADPDLIRRIVREEVGQNGARPAIAPVGELKERYMERAAQRLVTQMNDLTPDAREALLFLLAHDSKPYSIAAIASAITGHGDGSAHKRFRDATVALISVGLVREYGRDRHRMLQVDEWVKKGLSGHNASDDDIARIRDRALEVILIDG